MERKVRNRLVAGVVGGALAVGLPLAAVGVAVAGGDGASGSMQVQRVEVAAEGRGGSAIASAAAPSTAASSVGGGSLLQVQCRVELNEQGAVTARPLTEQEWSEFQRNDLPGIRSMLEQANQWRESLRESGGVTSKIEDPSLKDLATRMEGWVGTNFLDIDPSTIRNGTDAECAARATQLGDLKTSVVDALGDLIGKLPGN